MSSHQDLAFDQVTARQWLGQRSEQDDSFIHSGPDTEGWHFAFISDGAGPSSRSAADVAVRNYASIVSEVTVEALPSALLNGPEQVAQQLTQRDLQSACTLTGVVLADGFLWTVNHGDSTAVVLRGRRLVHINRYHNAAEDDRILGNPPRPHSAQQLTAALGRTISGTTEVGVVLPRSGDLIILMTDGMADLLPLGRLAMLNDESDRSIDVIVEALAQAAIDAVDNATVVVARIVPRTTR